MAVDFEIVPGKIVGDSQPCFIIAEVGQNHQGNINIAKTLIRLAKACGADCVKFQKTCLTEKFNAAALLRPYNDPNSWGKTYGEHKAYLEFSEKQFEELQTYATHDVGIIFTASAMDLVSLDVLVSMNVPFLKIGSGDANNFPLLEYAASKGKPLVISTGMQSLETVRNIYHSMKKFKTSFCLLHCVSSYPAPPQQVNLRVISTYKSEFPDIHIGYSGHELGTTISVGAVALGARILERHITLDKSWKGSDHICSLTPDEFQDLVIQIRTLEMAMGSPLKQIQPCEIACYEKLGKTIVAAKSLQCGEVIGCEDIKVKVADPKGWPAEDIKKLLGKTLLRNIPLDESILLTDVM